MPLINPGLVQPSKRIRLKQGDYILPEYVVQFYTGPIGAPGYLLFEKFLIHERETFDRLAIFVDSAGLETGKVKLAIYKADDFGEPTELLDVGVNVDVDVYPPGIKEVLIDAPTLDKGWYCLAYLADHSNTWVAYNYVCTSFLPIPVGRTLSPGAYGLLYRTQFAQFDLPQIIDKSLLEPYFSPSIWLRKK